MPPAESELIEDDMPTEVQPVVEPALGDQPEAVRSLTISDGQTVAVEGPVVIGRAPVASRTTGEEEPLLVSVPSPLHEISSTHVEVRPGPDGAIVTDLGSTNGTVVVPPGAGPQSLEPGVPVSLVPGSLINLGDGVTIEVT